MPQRIQFKIAALPFDCVRGTVPAYFSSIACTVADNSGRPGFRSAERGDLFVPWTRTTRLGRRNFFIAAPVVWNSLPLHLRSPSISRSQFRAGLNTHLFKLAFHWLFLWELLKRLNWTECVLKNLLLMCSLHILWMFTLLIYMIRNCIGLVVYTGRETKVMLNSTTVPRKRSSVERTVNRQVCDDLVLTSVHVLKMFARTNAYLQPYLFIFFIIWLYRGYNTKWRQ